MPHYCNYRGQHLTISERPNGQWNVRLVKSKNQSLIMHIGDVLVLTTKNGDVKEIKQIQAFIPRIKYGGYTTTGLVFFV